MHERKRERGRNEAPEDARHRQDVTVDDALDALAHPSAAPPPDPETGEMSGSGGWGLGANSATADLVPGRDATPLTRTGDPAILSGRTSPADRAQSPRSLTVTGEDLEPPAVEER
jgi:hypothetical protein